MFLSYYLHSWEPVFLSLFFRCRPMLTFVFLELLSLSTYFVNYHFRSPLILHWRLAVAYFTFIQICDIATNVFHHANSWRRLNYLNGFGYSNRDFFMATLGPYLQSCTSFYLAPLPNVFAYPCRIEFAATKRKLCTFYLSSLLILNYIFLINSPKMWTHYFLCHIIIV